MILKKIPYSFLCAITIAGCAVPNNTQASNDITINSHAAKSTQNINIPKKLKTEQKATTLNTPKYKAAYDASAEPIADTSRLTPEVEKSELLSIEALEDKALDLHLKAWAEGDKADPDLVGDYIEYMQNLIKVRPDTMTYPFRILVGDGALDTATSSDNKLRFYSFNTEMGGSMQFYDTIYQTKDNGVVKVTEVAKEREGDNGYFVSDIYMFKAETQTYYVVIANRIASNRDVAQTAFAYTIKNGVLEPVDLFKTAKRTYKDIAVKYNFFSAIDTHDERPIRVIRYDYDNKQLLFALIDEAANVTDKNLIYQWTGSEFKYIGIR